MSATMDDVAARAGVSRASVSLALRHSPKISPARRAEIQRVAAELGYRPNANASRLARTKTGTIGVVLSDLHNSLFAEMVDGLAAALEGEPEQLLIASGFHDKVRERAAVESFLSLRVDGLALMGSQLPAEEIQRVAQEIPTVIAGRKVEGVDSVSVDDVAGASLATEHLIALGHRRIAHIDGGEGAGAQLRRGAFLDTMARHGLATQASVMGGDYTERGGRTVTLSLLANRQPPTAIFAANDLSALGALSAARSLGIQVPSGLSIIGFDNTKISQSYFVSLSTIDYPRFEMGQRALEQLRMCILKKDKDPVNITLAPDLVERDTTTAVSADKR